MAKSERDFRGVSRQYRVRHYSEPPPPARCRDWCEHTETCSKNYLIHIRGESGHTTLAATAGTPSWVRAMFSLHCNADELLEMLARGEDDPENKRIVTQIRQADEIASS